MQMAAEHNNQTNQAISHHVELAAAFETLAAGLNKFITTRMQAYLNEDSWTETAANKLGRPNEHGSLDPLFQLLVLRRFWGPVFADHFKQDLRPIISNLIDIRNKWAHFAVPDDPDLIDRAVLGMERILSPISPESSIKIRKIRGRILRKESTIELVDIDVDALEKQLLASQNDFQKLQDVHSSLNKELVLAKKIAAKKQQRLRSIEKQLLIIQDKTLATEAFLLSEQTTRNRIEWLFVGLLAAILLVFVVLN